MAKNGGTNGNWTPVAREVKDKAWARNPHRFALWIHLLLRAAWKRHPTNYRGHDYDLHPGEFPTTIRELAKQTGLSRGTVERDILWYKAESMIETKTTGGSTLIKILNSPNYPFGETKFETNLGQSLGQGSGTLQNKEPKTEEGDTEEKKPTVKKFDPLTLELPENVDRELWNDWVGHRKQINKPLTEIAVKRQLKKLGKAPNANEILEYSVMQGYQGLYAPNKDRGPNYRGKTAAELKQEMDANEREA